MKNKNTQQKITLSQTQQNFLRHIFDKNNQKILSNISHSKEESLARLNIYRNNVFGGANFVFNNIFFVTKKILGEKEFQSLFDEYNKKYGSNSGNLDNYGKHFPKFIKDFANKYKIKYLPELTKLELEYYQCYFSQDAKLQFDVKKFKKLPQEKLENLTFFLHPTVKLYRSNFPIHSIWHGKKNVTKPEFAMLYRPQNECHLLKLSKEEFAFLQSISKNKKLFDIYKIISKNSDCDIGKMVNKFIKNGTIIGF